MSSRSNREGCSHSSTSQRASARNVAGPSNASASSRHALPRSSAVHIGSSSSHPPPSRRGGSRPGAGRQSRSQEVTIGTVEMIASQIDVGVTREIPQSIMQPHNPEEAYIDSLSSSGISSDRDRTAMRFAAKPRAGIHRDVKYVWDSNAESIRLGNNGSSSHHDQQILSNEFPACCSLCGEASHRSNACPLSDFGWVLRIRNCRYCGCVILGAEKEGICCGYRSSTTIGITFKRRHTNMHLEDIYRLRSFQSLSTHLNLLFATVVTFMDMKYVRGGGPSFLRLQGNVSLSVPGREVQYTYLWSDGPPSLNFNDYSAAFTRRIISNRNIRYLVPKLYDLLRPRPEIVRNRYRNLFDVMTMSENPQRGEESFIEVSEDAAQEGIVVRNYQGAHEARIEIAAGMGPLPEDSRGRPLAMRAFIVEPTGLFRSQAPVAQLVGARELHSGSRRGSSNRVVKYKQLKPDSMEAERGAFPLLYPYGDVHIPYDSSVYVENRNASSSRGGRRGAYDAKILTWAEHSKRRLYSDNLLLNSGTLLQQWLLRTYTNIEDLRLRYLEKEQMRMVEEQELRAGTHTGTDEIGPPGKLFLPGSHKNSPAYWRQKRLDVQAMVSRLGSPTLFITITMNVWREEMKRLGLDNENRASFSPQGDKFRPFDRPDLVARVYNQYANAILKDLQSNSEELFGLKCIGIAAKLEFQERNTPHHHVLLWLEGGVIEDPEVIDGIIKAELPRGNSAKEIEIRKLVKKFNIHRHSPYCRGRTSNGTCRFGYDRAEIVSETSIDDLTNRVRYRRREEEDFKVVPYNPELTLKYKAHINVERTQGGGAVAYLMKYAFKSAKEQDVVISSRNESGQDEELQNEIRAYMRARVVGSVEAAWNLLEFRHVRINPSVLALDIHLEGRRQVLVRNVRLPRTLKSSLLERYFKRPTRYHNLDYMTYYETVRIYERLPRSVQQSEATKDDANPRKFVVKRTRDDSVVTRIRYASPANTELFALRTLLMNDSFKSFDEPKRFENESFLTYREAAIARGLYIHQNEHETAFDEAVRHSSTPAELRFMVVTAYQQGVNPRILIEKHESILTSDIVNGSSSYKMRELLRRIISISDKHGGRLIRKDPFFEHITASLRLRESEVERAVEETNRRQNSPELSIRGLKARYDSLRRRQGGVFDEMMSEILERGRMTESQRCNTHGKVFFLQGRAGTGKTYLLSLLRDMVEHKGHLVQMTATTGIAASLYENGRTLHSLLGLGVEEEKDSQSRERRSLSKYGPRSQRAELLRKVVLLVIDEASMCPKVLFEIVDTVLKDLRNSNKDFGGMVIVMAGDYMQLLPVVPKTRTIRERDGSSREVPVSLLRELPWYSCELWDRRVKVLRLTEQVRQQGDQNFADTLLSLGRGTFPANEKLPFMSTSNVKEAYKRLWKWVETQNKRDVRLDRLLVAPTNQLVDEHNDNALRLFPGRKHLFISATTIVPIRRQDGSSGQGNSLIGPELTYNYSPTGIPKHKLELKIGVPVMVIRNVLHPYLLNGKMFVISGIERRVLRLSEIDERGNRTRSFLLHRIDFVFEFSEVKIKRRQFPVKLAFAATVHKSQGQTLKKMIIDFRVNFFSPGQVYVGLSRVRRSDDVLLIHNQEDDPIRSGNFHLMSVTVKNPTLREAVRFVEGI